MIWTNGPCRRQATTKWRRPPGWRTITIAGQHAVPAKEDVIEGNQDLLGDQPDVVREIFEGVDRGAVDSVWHASRRRP